MGRERTVWEQNRLLCPTSEAPVGIVLAAEQSYGAGVGLDDGTGLNRRVRLIPCSGSESKVQINEQSVNHSSQPLLQRNVALIIQSVRSWACSLTNDSKRP